MRGVYVLVIQLRKNAEVRVGKLGTFHFPAGLYAYVGSAQNNLERRIERHRRPEKRVFWHIDYLLRNPDSKILKVFYKIGGRTEECKTARKIEGEPILGFGCSDCRCRSHLIRIEAYDSICRFMREYRTSNFSAAA